MRMRPIFMTFVFSVLVWFINQFESKDGQETLAKLADVIFLCSFGSLTSLKVKTVRIPWLNSRL